jgi:hypothetical protein
LIYRMQNTTGYPMPIYWTIRRNGGVWPLKI